MSARDILRFKGDRKCPVCGGCDDDPRGQGSRCHGYLSGDRKTIFCSRDEHAGGARHDAGSNCYMHDARGPCPCGKEHAPAPARGRKRQGTIDRVHQYRDAAGKVVHETVRWKDPKGFSQRRPLGNGTYKWSLKGIATVLYRLPELLAADPAAPVYVVEGEKDADRLALHGFVATTNPMGAEKWRDHYSEALRGRDVVVIPDADPPEPKYPKGKGRHHAEQVAASLYGKAASVRIVELPGVPQKGDASDFLDGAGTIDQLRDLAANAPEWTPPATGPAPSGNPAAPGPAPSSSQGENQSQILLRLADAATLFHDATGRTYAAVPINGHVEVHEITSTGFRRWLKGQFYEEENRPPAAQALQDALGMLDSHATYRGREEEVFVRVAGDADRIFIDLGDASWRAVRIDSAGWCLTSNPPIRFRRPPGMRPLPEPARGGTIDRLGDFVNIEAAELPLLIAWLAAALRPSGPYPILVLIGEQGSAKSTLARLARRLADPHASPLRCEPKESRDLMVGAVNGWILALDNLSTIWAWLSDSLCRLSTGGGFATRTLYSNDEETFLDATRPVILTGITDFVSRGDLIDRSLFLHLAVIPEEKRRTEGAFWRDFEAALPQLFGALLDALAGGLRLLPEVEQSAPRLPRMADFALFGESVSRALGNPPGTFLDAYRQNRRDANESAVEDNPVAGAVRELASKGEWTGTARKLLDDVRAIVEPPEPQPDGFRLKAGGTRSDSLLPKSPRGMSGAIRRLAPSLRMVGVHIDLGERTNKARLITIRLAESGGSGPSPSSLPSPDAANAIAPNDLRGDGPGDGRVTVAPSAESTVTAPSPDRHSPNGFVQKDLGMSGDGRDGRDGPIPAHSADPIREVF